jgi:hypothetical protein
MNMKKTDNMTDPQIVAKVREYFLNRVAAGI